jgi:predicted DNA-binding transcriptional regulator YafY
MSNVANTSERMLRLLSLLQSHRDWSGAELADRLEVSPRTVRRDVDRLRVLGYPVDATPGVDGGYRLAAGAALPPLVLDDDEAVALVIALRATATLAISGAAEASVNALAKVVQVLPARLRHRAENIAQMTTAAAWSETSAGIDPMVLAMLATSARNLERVEFTYTDRQSSTEDRLVEPAQLVMLGRRWYLVAYDANRHDWRTFRVDRVREPHGTGRHFNPKPIPLGDAATYVRSSIRSATPTNEIVVDIAAPAEAVRERYGNWATVTEIDTIDAIDVGVPGSRDRRCRMVMSSDGFGWPMMMLASLDAEFSVISPPECRQHLAAAGQLFTRWADA